ncbi:hypothetical protein DBR18_06940 [Pseudomonas sp. HMWF021]|nr:hypothetical protein DBR18_06940 [Pseudomonas sp. HMWF021]
MASSPAGWLPHFCIDTKPCRSCRRLRSFDLESQKIAAFGSSYRDQGAAKISLWEPVPHLAEPPS